MVRPLNPLLTDFLSRTLKVLTEVGMFLADAPLTV